MPIKALTEDGGSFEEIAAGIRWAVDHNADVITMSLGALPGVHALVITGLIPDVADAIAYAYGRGIPVLVAAGNEFASICAEPAFDAGALCVTSTDRNELRSSFSNFGVKPDLNVVPLPAALRCSRAATTSCPPFPPAARARAAATGTTTTPARRWRRRMSPESPRCSRRRVEQPLRSTAC
jgi:subtilisin family serine protease